MKTNSVVTMGLAFSLFAAALAGKASARSSAETNLPTVLPKKATVAQVQTLPANDVPVVVPVAPSSVPAVAAAPVAAAPVAVATPVPAVPTAAPIQPEIVEPLVIVPEKAGEYKVEIKEVDAAKKAAVLGVSGDASFVIAGGTLILKNGDTQICSVLVLETRLDLARADLTNCPIDQVKPGQRLERSLFDQFAQTAPAASAGGEPASGAVTASVSGDASVNVTKLKAAAPARAGLSDYEEERPVRFSLALYLTSADTFHFNEGRYYTATSQGDFTGEFGSEGSGGLGIAVGTSRRYGWGATVGVSFDGKRELGTFKRKEDGVTTEETFTGTKPALSLTTVDFNANLRANRGFAFAGLNYSFPHYHAVPGAIGTVRTGGGVGTQIGIGSHLSDVFAIELMARLVRFSMAIDSPTLSWEMGMMSLAGLQLQTRFTF
ncbi:MAG TPA: hypothetical protein VFV50_03245 [Bdellovibrionales bacterium]|nr:hypothetical protein [Bdellovibrionales bacterium]